MNLDSADHYLNRANLILQEMNNSYLNAKYYEAYGKYLLSSGHSKDAVHFFMLSMKLFKEVDSINEIQGVCNNIGNCYYNLGMYDSAIFYHGIVTGMIDLTSSSKDKFLMLAANYNNLANVYSEISENEKALDHYLKALDIFKQLKNDRQVAITLDNIGQINLDIKEYKKAIEYFRGALRYNIESGNKYNQCMNLDNLGVTYQNLDQYDSSLYYLSKALELAEKSGFNVRLAQTNHNIGSLFIKMGKYDEALVHFNKSLSISRELDHISGEVLNLFNIGKVYAEKQQFKLAETNLLEALKLKNGFDRLSVLSNIYKELAYVYEKSGRYKEALENFIIYESLKDSIYNIELVGQVKELQTKYETGEKERENLQLKNQNEINKLIINRQRIIVLAASFIVLLSIIILIILMANRASRKKQLILLREQNALIEKKSRQLKESNYTKDMLFSIIAHDLRSPFNSILGFSSMLDYEVKAGNTENLKEFITEIKNSSEKAFYLVDNLLNWAKSQQNKIEVNIKSIILPDLVNEVTDVMLSFAESKRVELVNDVQPDTTIKSDSDILKVILRNLINNAIKFCYENGKVEISCDERNDHFMITVRDNGRGMKPELTDHLLKNKNTFEASGKEKARGSGLGLLLVRDFLRKLGGELFVESTEGKGSAFSFSIPKQ